MIKDYQYGMNIHLYTVFLVKYGCYNVFLLNNLFYYLPESFFICNKCNKNICIYKKKIFYIKKKVKR